MKSQSLGNIEAAKQVLEELARFGLTEIVFCAGSRNAPFIQVLDHVKNARIYSFFEERSAAFFALGRSRALGLKPVAIVTTSGTASAELLPACIEAYYSGAPLVLITCDRPRRMRLTGAPQCIDQTGLMSDFVEHFYDLEKSALSIMEWSLRKPIHVNICFDEPLLDQEVSDWNLPTASPASALKKSLDVASVNSILKKALKPLVILGGLEDATEMKGALKICSQLRWPVYAEGSSGLKTSRTLNGGDQIFKKLNLDVVLRLGSVPTTRLWRDLEDSSTEVVSVSPLNFTGISRSTFLQSSIHDFSLLLDVPPLGGSWLSEVQAFDQKFYELKISLFEKYPLAEPSFIRRLSQKIGNDFVYVGNSLPIREWDFAADSSAKVFANRGANGIDGQLSTFLGLTAHEHESSWCLTGDLTTMYDLSGPWILKSLAKSSRHFVIINNGGGKIFHRMYRNPLFENRHAIEFSGWAKMWGLTYEVCRGIEIGDSQVIEILPDAEQTEKFWNEFK